MAHSMISQPCGGLCKEEVEYLIKFAVTSLEFTDEGEDELFRNILVAVTWDGNVVKLQSNEEDSTEFDEQTELFIHASPENLSKKIKTCPIMINLSRGCRELGIVKMQLSDCFAEAVLCEDFNSQTFSNKFTFFAEESENATMNVLFRIEKLLSDEISKNLYESLRSQVEKWSKKKKIAGMKDSEGNISDDGSCRDFMCPDEAPEHCKQDFELDNNIYRIVNGNLVNIKDNIGPCGEKCPVPRKYIKELCQSPNVILPLSSHFDYSESKLKCGDIFEKSSYSTSKVKCPDCGGQKSCSKSLFPKSIDWIDRNIQEEDLLTKLCSKYEIDIGEVRAVGKKVNTKKSKKSKKKKTLNTKNSSAVPQNLNVEGFNLPLTREKFIKLMKRKSCGQYSYDFGNDYPADRPCTKIEKGGGDAEIVPKYMGWRWDVLKVGTNTTKWFPGQINKTVRCLMKYLLNPFPLDTIPLTRRDKYGRIMKKYPDFSQISNELVEKPTLKIHKRDGEISIIMNPLKDNNHLETCNPYLDCSPLKFKIRKHSEEIKKHRAKKLLNQRGFIKNCSCRTLLGCRCMSLNEKKLLSYEMLKISNEIKLKNILEFADFGNSSDSEMDVEFTTPAAKIENVKCKSDVTHCGTQYAIKDFVLAKVKNAEKIKIYVESNEKPKLKDSKAPKNLKK